MCLSERPIEYFPIPILTVRLWAKVSLLIYIIIVGILNTRDGWRSKYPVTIT
jgi:hypothetical protein